MFLTNTILVSENFIKEEGRKAMRGLPWGSLSIVYISGLFVTFMAAAPDAFDRCYRMSYCTSLVMENVAWSLAWPAYWLMS